MLEDTALPVRRATVQALGRLGGARTVPRFIALLDDPAWDIRENAWLGLRTMTAETFAINEKKAWQKWRTESPLEEKEQKLLRVASQPPPTAVGIGTKAAIQPAFVPTAPGRRTRSRFPSTPPAHPARLDALRALVHLATPAAGEALIQLLRQAQSPPLDPEERKLLCEALERTGSMSGVPILAAQRSDAAAWALGSLGGVEAERVLLDFPQTLPTLLALDRLRSTNAGPFLPHLVAQMGLITYRGQLDDVMNLDLQPIQRAGAHLLQRSGLAPIFFERVLQELEDTMKPPIAHGSPPTVPVSWEEMFQHMHSELRPGFVREDGVTTSQPVAALCYAAEDPALAARLTPLLRHPAVVVRVYVALALGRLHAHQALPAIVETMCEGYPFSDSVALASGKHFDQSQSVRWRGFLCLALGRLGGDDARTTLETLAADPKQPRDIRYGAVVGLGFIGSTASLSTLERVAAEDIIWLVRDEARQVSCKIQLTKSEARP